MIYKYYIINFYPLPKRLLKKSKSINHKGIKGLHKDFYDKTNRSLKIFSDWYPYPRLMTAHNL
jgi:hypothetical protein